jgi:hypothetical protein
VPPPPSTILNLAKAANEKGAPKSAFHEFRREGDQIT